MTPEESFSTRIERLQDGKTPGESFHPRTEGLQGSHSITGQMDSSGVILSWNGTTPGELFCLGIERLQGSHSPLR